MEELENHEEKQRKLPPLQQRLLLFLLLHYSDPFTVQLADVVGWWQLGALSAKWPVCGGPRDFCSHVCAATEVSIERHLEAILNRNKQAVVGAFQTEIKNTLKAQNRRKKASQGNPL